MILPTNLTDRKVHPPKWVYVWLWWDHNAHDPPKKPTILGFKLLFSGSDYYGLGRRMPGFGRRTPGLGRRTLGLGRRTRGLDPWSTKLGLGRRRLALADEFLTLAMADESVGQGQLSSAKANLRRPRPFSPKWPWPTNPWPCPTKVTRVQIDTHGTLPTPSARAAARTVGLESLSGHLVEAPAKSHKHAVPWSDGLKP